MIVATVAGNLSSNNNFFPSILRLVSKDLNINYISDSMLAIKVFFEANFDNIKDLYKAFYTRLINFAK